MPNKNLAAVSVVVASALLAAGCATQPSEQLTPLSPKNITIKRPALQNETTVEIGQSIMFWAYGPAETVIQLERPYEFEHDERSLSLIGPNFPAVAMLGNDYIARVNYVSVDGEFTAIKPGELLLSSGPEGCSLLVANTFSLPEAGGANPVDGISSIFSGKRAIFGGTKPAQEHQIPTEVCGIDQSTIADSEDSFRKELVYLGRSGDTIQLSYREFYNNMARPAFSNNIQYDLGDSDVIGFQGARFKVLSATNTFFTYEVMKHLQ
ncbi:hypothetical protein [Marinobacter zhanjiangensis]|uniref:DUF4249 family protein n=1 Tax=Marinobacter zhanjiangensis TaxID=578215 RepID=A0ABQ3BDJ5_9GAMM|nr:hypothetical protein [Marinobacter zhanjiangensis]GGY85425.1 hypothetical protein GCM10007071_35960 [Marinobacter zhanjiangensis]